MNCPSASDDSYWIKMDNGAYEMSNGLATTGWEWKKINLTNYFLTAGQHVLTIGYREDGAVLDKICISNYSDAPKAMGGTAATCTVTDIRNKEAVNGYALDYNYPNPFDKSTRISFEIPTGLYVSLKVYTILGEEITELAGKEYAEGKHDVDFNIDNLNDGIYLYTLKTGNMTITKKMILRSK